MGISRSYQNTLIILFSVSVLLLLSHLVFSLIHPGHTASSLVTLNDNEIDEKFLESLKSFELKDQWIKSVKTSSSKFAYSILLPNDLPIGQIIYELKKQYDGCNVKIMAEEKILGGRTIVKILSSDDEILNADFNYSDKISRTASESVLFIYGREQNEADYDSLFHNCTQTYSALLVPSKSSASFAKWLKSNDFDYAVLLNDNMNELEFRIKQSYDEKRLSLVVQNIVISFPDALFFVIDTNSNIYLAANFKILKSEFALRNIKLFPSDSLKFIDTNGPNYSEKLNKIVREEKSGEINRIAVSYNALLSLSEDLKKLIKVGYKFVRASIPKSEKKKKV